MPPVLKGPSGSRTALCISRLSLTVLLTPLNISANEYESAAMPRDIEMVRTHAHTTLSATANRTVAWSRLAGFDYHNEDTASKSGCRSAHFRHHADVIHCIERPIQWM